MLGKKIAEGICSWHGKLPSLLQYVWSPTNDLLPLAQYQFLHPQNVSPRTEILEQWRHTQTPPLPLYEVNNLVQQFNVTSRAGLLASYFYGVTKQPQPSLVPRPCPAFCSLQYS